MLSSTAMSKQSDGVSSLKTKDLNVSWMIQVEFFDHLFNIAPGFARAGVNPGGEHGREETLCPGRSLLHLDGWPVSGLHGHPIELCCCIPANSPDSLLYNLSVNSSEWLTCNRAQCPAWTWRPGWARWWRHSWLDQWVGPAQLFSSRYSSHLSKRWI